MTDSPFFTRLAAAYVRGRLQHDPVSVTYPHLFEPLLDMLTPADRDALIGLGQAQGLRLHRFKETMGLARVQQVLGMLKGIQPAELLDIGSGRGAFLWPLLDAFPDLSVTALDQLEYRVADIRAVHDGGVTTLTARHGDTRALAFPDRSFDVVTMLEVLEHIPDYQQALTEVCRVARRFLLLSVPSRPDDNPEHLHLFGEREVRSLLQPYATRVSIAYVHNHLIAMARM